MLKKDKQKIIERYEGRLKEFGPVQKSLGWLKGRQRFRFYYLEDIDIKQGESIMDIGCGYGDLYSHLKEGGHKGKYLGLDIVPGLVTEAKKRYPDADIKLVDILEDEFNEKCDWVFCSGALTSKTEEIDSYKHLELMLRKMFSLCNKGISVNFCSPVVDFQSEVNFHPHFDKLLNIVLGLTKRFTLRHDYMPYEFTIYLYKDDTVNKDINIFNSENEIYNALKVQE